MISPDELIKEARSWKGTRWVFGQCKKGVGTDCIQFAFYLLKYSKVVGKDYSLPWYSLSWARHSGENKVDVELEKFCVKVDYSKVAPGDFLTFRYARNPSHIALCVGSGKIVHSLMGAGVVEENADRYTVHGVSAWRLKIWAV